MPIHCGGKRDVGPKSPLLDFQGKRDVGPKSPLLEWAQHRAAVTGEGDRRAERNKPPGRSYAQELRA